MWTAQGLGPKSLGISFSRRTDCSFFTEWFLERLKVGTAKYVPMGPPRQVEVSLQPKDVTHFCFWSKWPRPFFPAVEQVFKIGYPMVWNVTVTGLGSTPVEPAAPSPERAVAAIKELAHVLPKGAIMWRYDPVFVSDLYPAEHHVKTFKALAGELTPFVDRVTISFVTPFSRIARNIESYEQTNHDHVKFLPLAEQVDLARSLQECAREMGLTFTTCCMPEVREILNCQTAGCNSWNWVCRVYPVLKSYRALRVKGTRPGCACSEEKDIGVYDTCPMGCCYSYGSANKNAVKTHRARHDPTLPCIVPE